MNPSNADERPPRSRVAFQLFALFLLLVVTPAVSWFYLREGLAYRKDHLDQLSRLGPPPVKSWVPDTDARDGTASYEGQVSLVALVKDSILQREADRIFRLLHHQFDDREDVKFYTYLPGSARQHPIPQDTAQWKVFHIPDSMMQSWSALWKAPGAEMAPDLILIDPKGEMRRHMNLDTTVVLKNLVAEMAVLLPPKKVSKPQLKREAEK